MYSIIAFGIARLFSLCIFSYDVILSGWNIQDLIALADTLISFCFRSALRDGKCQCNCHSIKLFHSIPNFYLFLMKRGNKDDVVLFSLDFKCFTTSQHMYQSNLEKVYFKEAVLNSNYLNTANKLPTKSTFLIIFKRFFNCF